MTTIEIAAKLTICQPAVSRLSKRGGTIARELGVDLIEQEEKHKKIDCINGYRYAENAQRIAENG